MNNATNYEMLAQLIMLVATLVFFFVIMRNT